MLAEYPGSPMADAALRLMQAAESSRDEPVIGDKVP